MVRTTNSRSICVDGSRTRFIGGWHGRITTRGLADSPGSFMTGGTLAQWFDVLVHRQEVSPAHPV